MTCDSLEKEPAWHLGVATGKLQKLMDYLDGLCDETGYRTYIGIRNEVDEIYDDLLKCANLLVRSSHDQTHGLEGRVDSGGVCDRSDREEANRLGGVQTSTEDLRPEETE